MTFDLPEVRHTAVDQRALNGAGPHAWMHTVEIVLPAAPPAYLTDPVSTLDSLPDQPVLTVEQVGAEFVLRATGWAPTPVLDPYRLGLLQGCLNEGHALARL